MNVLEAALAYNNLGYSVIPVKANDKRPALESWKEYQTRKPTMEELKKWFSGNTINIGIITGVLSGLTVIDLDGSLGYESAKSLLPKLPTTRVHKTPHGHHLLYRYSPELHTGAAFAPGIDVRNDGGYVVAPPSIIDGISYSILADLPIVEIPDVPRNLVAREKKRVEDGEEKPTWVSDLLDRGSPEHQRNNDGTRLVGYFHAHGIPDDIIFTSVRPWAEKCAPPFEETELKTIIRSVGRYQVVARSVGIDAPPKFEKRGQAHRYTWENGVTIQFDRLHEDKDGVYAEINVSCTIPGVPGQLHGPVRFNLTATQSRTTLVNYLNKRIEIPEWAQFLEQASQLAVAQYRAGEPVQNLADHLARREGQWCLWPFIAENQVNILYGDGATAKSTIALALMVSIQTGEPIVGEEPKLLHKGLYLDWEDDVETHGERYGWLNIQTEAQAILYRKMYGTLADQIDEVRRLVDEHNIGFLVVDSAALACGSEPEKAEPPIRLFNAIRSIGVTTLLIAHINKEGGLYGNVAWRNYGRNVWKTEKQQTPGEDTMEIGLFHKKSNRGRLEKPQGFRISWGEGSITFKRIEVLDIPELVESVGITARMIDAFKINRSLPMTVKQMAAALGKSENTIGNYFRNDGGKRFKNLGGDPAKWGLHDTVHHQ